MILWFQFVMQCWLWALLGLVLLGFPQKFCRGTTGQMMCETWDHCVPAQRWPRALSTGAGPGRRSLLTSLLPTTPQGFKHLSPSFPRCPNLGSMCGLRHPKWCLLKPAESRRKWKVSLPIAKGIWTRSSSSPNHSSILWNDSMKIKEIDW